MVDIKEIIVTAGIVTAVYLIIEIIVFHLGFLPSSVFGTTTYTFSIEIKAVLGFIVSGIIFIIVFLIFQAIKNRKNN